MNDETELIFIEKREEGHRLDKILATRFSDIKSRSYFQHLIENSFVLLNGSPVKKRILPKAGDEVEIQFVLPDEIDLEPENIPLDIIFEDDDLLVVNKPAGMVVHPAPGNWRHTFVNALLYHCKNQIVVGQSLRPGIVHRLDKDTTGLLIAAKTSLAHERLVSMFANKEIHKEYLAICIGNPGEREVKTKIGRHKVNRKLMSVVEEGGKEAYSVLKTIAHYGNFSLVNINLKTGRTHQIRVHLKHVNAPILGCPLYGVQDVNKKYGVERQMLHAFYLNFVHPITKVPLEFKLKLPEDMQAFLNSHFMSVNI